MMNPTTDIRLQFLASRPALCLGEETELDVLVRVHTPDLPAAAQGANAVRPPLNLSLVLDRSGSMGGTKMAYARQAAVFAAEQLRADDRVSVVTFDSVVETPVPSMPAADKALLRRRIERIEARGSTALHAGWVEGGAQVGAHLDARRLNRVILFTDGQANIGETQPDAIASDVRGLAARGVSTTTLGIGADYNEDLLEAMARAGDGNYYFIESPGQLPSLFESELRGLLATLGRSVSLGLEPTVGVEIAEVLNDLGRNSYGRLLLPNLLAGAPPVEVALRLRVPASHDARKPVCTFRLAWDDPKTGRRHKLRESLTLPARPPAEASALPANPDVETAVALLRVAREKRRVVEQMERGDIDAARRGLEAVRAMTAAAPSSASSQAEHQDLDRLEEMLSEDVGMTTKLAKEQIYRRHSSKGQK